MNIHVIETDFEPDDAMALFGKNQKIRTYTYMKKKIKIKDLKI